MALPPESVNSFSIAAAEPLSRAVSMTTFAPAARHACACAFCLVGSLRALLIEADTPAFLNALAKSGASNCTQRTDDLVSGSRTQTWTLALLDANAPPATSTAVTETSSRDAAHRTNLLTCFSFGAAWCSGGTAF